MTEPRKAQPKSTAQTPMTPRSEETLKGSSQLKASLRGHDYATQVQMLSPNVAAAGNVHEAAAKGVSGSSRTLPHMGQIQQSFGGYDISNVQAHTDPLAQEGARAMGADAYATGNQIVLGERGDKLHTVAHETTHVIQQRAGVSLPGGVGSVGDVYEKQANAVADLVVQGKSAEGVLGTINGSGGSASAVQRQPSAQSPAPQEDLLAVAERFVAWDPATLRVVGEILGVKAEPPGPDFVAALKVWQADKGCKPNGNLDGKTLPKLQALRKKELERQAAAEGTDIKTLTANCPLLSRSRGRAANKRSIDSGGRVADDGYKLKKGMRNVTFIGHSVKDGVHSIMAEALGRTEAALKVKLGDALADPDAQRTLATKGVTDNSPASLGKWLGIRQPHTGWRGGKAQGYHRYGLAIDINRDLNAWHAVRTGQHIGGEGTALEKASFDRQALVIIDRANLFMRKSRAELQAVDKGLADRPGAAEAVALKSGDASKAVAEYFQLVFVGDDALLQWDARAVDGVKLPSNLTELSEEKAIHNIDGIIQSIHGGAWARTSAVMREQIRKDLFPLARQMSKDTMSAAPKQTKNPTNGFFNIDAKLAEALAQAGRLVWGACELGVSQSGDAMHFDTGKVPPDALVPAAPIAPVAEAGENAP